MVKDYLGTPIQVGDRCIRTRSVGYSNVFVKARVEKIDEGRGADCVGVITGNNTRVGWTYQDRIIVQKSLTVKL